MRSVYCRGAEHRCRVRSSVGLRLAVAGAGLLFSVLSAQTPQADVVYLSHEQARPVFDALGERLPSASAWRDWIETSDRDTRARVSQGDETSVVNLLLFGTSFTNEPRITSTQLVQQQVAGAVAARLADFERAVQEPGETRTAPVRATGTGRSFVGARSVAVDARADDRRKRNARASRSRCTGAGRSQPAVCRAVEDLSRARAVVGHVAPHQLCRRRSLVPVRGADPQNRPRRHHRSGPRFCGQAGRA